MRRTPALAIPRAKLYSPGSSDLVQTSMLNENAVLLTVAG